MTKSDCRRPVAHEAVGFDRAKGPTASSRAQGRLRAFWVVPTTQAERPVSVQLPDSRWDAREWARRAESSRSLPSALGAHIASIGWMRPPL
jgi:hypothetical protein